MHLIVKLLRAKKKILKTDREKQHIVYKRITIQIVTDSLSERKSPLTEALAQIYLSEFPVL